MSVSTQRRLVPDVRTWRWADRRMIPPVWRQLLADINDPPLRIPDGTAGIRGVDAPCDGFQPAGAP